ncbi:MAG: ribosomal RNA small subunit methyltransferase A, partial [Verrucomicrobiales bacterium]|nr:ribosomal RNA small subunit methyltransferase A [Verrucomicrobiales bacterium]
SLGQNFLVDEDLARWIADQVEPDGAPLVIEAGPGLRALTQHLEDRPKHLLLVEKDRELVATLREHYLDEPGVTVLEADATRFDLRPWYAYGEVGFIGNLPYSVGGEILRHVLTPPTPVRRAVFMLQKEVCQRLAAVPGAAGCGALSALVQVDWEVEMLRVVPPEVFRPRPKVDSAVVRLTPRDPASLPVFDRRVFDRLVRVGFGQRRKQLKNLLPPGPDTWEAAAAAVGLLVTARAEELSLLQWVALARWYEGRGATPDEGQSGEERFDVVDEWDAVIGQETRAQVHATGLRHRAVHLLIWNGRGEVFLQQRSHLKDVAPLKWDSSAAGHLDAGETYAQAAVRELREEAGIAVETTERVLKIPASAATGHEFVELHQVKTSGRIHWPPEEVRTGEWFLPEQLDDWIERRPSDFAGGFITCWKAWRQAGSPMPSL